VVSVGVIQMMFGSLFNLLKGWREVRVLDGYSYQVSRTGKRRALPLHGAKSLAACDDSWLRTGRWSDAHSPEQRHSLCATGRNIAV